MAESSLLNIKVQRLIAKREWNKIIETLDKLDSREVNTDFFHCKIVALITLDRVDEALSALQKFPHFAVKLSFEEAYCLYRQNRIEEALVKIVSSPVKYDIKFRELKAQIFYRLEKHEESYELYKKLIKETLDEYDEERKTNCIANIARLACKKEISYFPSDYSIGSYEVLFNTACYLMNIKKYCEAESCLSQAEKLCSEALCENTGEECRDLDMLKTQLACCKHFQKKVKQALKLYSQILEKKPTDFMVLAVANNNFLAGNTNQNVFEMKKKMKVLLSDTVMSKLTEEQKRTVDTNINLINALNANSMESGLKLCDEVVSKYPENVETVVLLKAAIFMKFKRDDSAIVVLEDQMKYREGSKLKMCLAIAQLYLNVGKYEEACRTFKSLGEDMFRPGVVSSLVTILIALGDTAGALELLESAVEWNSRYKGNVGELSELWQHAVNLHLKRGQTKPALRGLQELLKINPDDYVLLSKLVLVYSKMKNPQALVLCEEIRERVNLKPWLTGDQQESSEWMLNFKSAKKLSNKDQSPGTPFSRESSKRRRKSKKKLPKNYDPEISPDPERWLPLHMRSYFKKKKDRRNRESTVWKGTQGVSSPATEQFDITKICSQKKDSSSAPVHKTFSQSNKIQRRKKKKGRKL